FFKAEAKEAVRSIPGRVVSSWKMKEYQWIVQERKRFYQQPMLGRGDLPDRTSDSASTLILASWDLEQRIQPRSARYLTYRNFSSVTLGGWMREKKPSWSWC
ncbi:hypothetical protein H1C71_014604, partial [Ictidomys tridecemlineatus]